MQKVLTIVGARPQFIKASMVSRAFKRDSDIEEVILHTGQHFDANMSDIFFNQLDLPRPTISLDINGGGHGEMTGRMLIEIEQALLSYKPDRILVYGDTNSTLAGALAAAKLHIPVAHIEAGLRSFNRKMPEEVNRILTDHMSDLLFCPTSAAVLNLQNEGFSSRQVKIIQVGDVMQDAALLFAQRAVSPSNSLPEGFVLATLHRAENTDSAENLAAIVAALNEIHKSLAPVVLPLHPRTRKQIEKQNLRLNVHQINPVGYFEMIWLLDNCRLVMTDSGGVQKEAFFFGKACITLREETEWIELVEKGVNELVGANRQSILAAARLNIGREVKDEERLYGGGEASRRIVNELARLGT
jgi:UDP-GlcNAc3NAcA epimerase